jgi:hypothetical protein
MLPAMLVALLVMCVASTAFAGIDPPIKDKWGSFSGRWPVTVQIVDCKRLNLRTTPSLAGNWNIAAYPPRGTTMKATGRVENFIQVEWNGRTLYGYAAYLVPINDVPVYEPPVVVQPPIIVLPPVYYPVFPATPIQPPQYPSSPWPQPPAYRPGQSYPPTTGYPAWPTNPYNPWRPPVWSGRPR